MHPLGGGGDQAGGARALSSPVTSPPGSSTVLFLGPAEPAAVVRDRGERAVHQRESSWMSWPTTAAPPTSSPCRSSPTGTWLGLREEVFRPPLLQVSTVATTHHQVGPGRLPHVQRGAHDRLLQQPGGVGHERHALGRGGEGGGAVFALVPSVKDLDPGLVANQVRAVDRALASVPVIFPNVKELKLLNVALDVNSVAHLEMLGHCLTEMTCRSISEEVRLCQILKCCQTKTKKLELPMLHALVGRERGVAEPSLPCLKALVLSDGRRDATSVVKISPALEELFVWARDITNSDLLEFAKTVREGAVLRHLKTVKLTIGISRDGLDAIVTLLVELMRLPAIRLGPELHDFHGKNGAGERGGDKEMVLAAAREKKGMEVSWYYDCRLHVVMI